MGKEEIESFLTHLALKEKVAASTQNQALNTILFLYRHVLNQPFESELNSVRARRHKHVPTVLTREEVQSLINLMTGTNRLIAQMLYGSGLRVSECTRLRVKDLDFERLQITVRDTKGTRDRYTIMPKSIYPTLQIHLQAVKLTHENDLQQGLGTFTCPTHWRRNTHIQIGSGSGNMLFRLQTYQSILDQVFANGITSILARSKKQSERW